MIDSWTFTHKGIEFRVTTEPDNDHPAPWEDDDGRGVVTDWLDDDQKDAHPHELRELGYRQHSTRRYFDLTATREKAKAESWGIQHDTGLTPAQIQDAAVEAEYVFLNEWATDQWSYIGVVVTLPGTDLQHSVWGVESNAQDHIRELAIENAEEILHHGPDVLLKTIERLTDLRLRMIVARGQEARA